jgi:hypothetical protein
MTSLLPWACTGRPRINFARYFTVILVVSATVSGRAQSTNQSALKQVGPGRFQIGRVTLDKESRSVTFPATVNMTEAIVEYVVVTPDGKVHESLLRTEASPRDIHVAMLLLDAKGSTNAVPEDPLKPIPGDPVIIEVSWKDKDREKRLRVEELILNTQLKTNLTKGVWIYNGSRIENGAFMAEREGSIVSLITDPFALVNNPRPGRDNDDLCEVNSKTMPPLDTAVQVRFTLQTAKK